MALITDMSVPLGNNIGNNLEVIEAVNTLKGKGPEDLTEVCIELASRMIYLGEKAESLEDAEIKAREAIKSGSALNTLIELVKAQGGDPSYIENTEKFPKTKYLVEIKAEKDGYITEMNAETIGIAACEAGAGRETKEDVIDPSAGIILYKKTPSFVNIGDTIAVIYGNDENKLNKAAESFKNAIKISGKAVKTLPHILDTVE